MWRDLFEGFTEGFVTAAARETRALASTSSTCDRGRIDRLCRELRWSVDEREGNMIRLHFNGPDGATRKVRIQNGDGTCVTFSAYSEAVVPMKKVSNGVLAYLLRRNLDGSGIGMWGIYVDDDDDVVFVLLYPALGDGLDAAALQQTCNSLLAEVADFDEKMEAAGLL
jgi:hypothetical protein